MHLAESSSTLFCLWTGLSLPVALHPASQRRSYLQLRTGQCSRPERTFTLLLVRTFRRTCPRHFVPGYDRTVSGTNNIPNSPYLRAIQPWAKLYSLFEANQPKHYLAAKSSFATATT